MTTPDREELRPQVEKLLTPSSSPELSQVPRERVIFDPREHARRKAKAFLSYETIKRGVFPNTGLDMTTILTREDYRLDIFINILNDITPIANLSYKGNNSHPEEIARAKEKYFVTSTDNWQTEEEAFIQYDKLFESHESIVINDIGGKRAHLIRPLVGRYGSRIKGGLEDTTNGGRSYLKYKKQFGDTVPCPILLVDRTVLKNMGEDRAIGPSLMFSAEAILREDFGETLLDLTNRHVLQIGYGNIGKATANDAKRKGCDTTVCDISNLKLFDATNDHDVIATNNLQFALESANQIFVATNGTGNPEGWGLKAKHFPYIQDGAKVGWGTSPETQADVQALLDQYYLEPLPGSKNVVVCYSKKPNSTHYFFLYRGLKTLNFAHGGVVGPKIYAVQKLIKIGNQLLCAGALPKDITVMPLDIQEEVAGEYLEYYIFNTKQISNNLSIN